MLSRPGRLGPNDDGAPAVPAALHPLDFHTVGAEDGCGLRKPLGKHARRLRPDPAFLYVLRDMIFQDGQQFGG